MLKKAFLQILAEKKFFKSFSYLSLTEGLNILFPMLIVPIIISKVGMEGYGKSGLVQSIMLILAVITDWGFNITAIRDISNAKDDKKAVSSLISSVFATKFYLLISVLIGYTAVVFILGIGDKLLYLSSITLLIGKTIAPNWFYSATERNEYNAISAFIANIFYLVLLFFFLKAPQHYWLVIFLQGVSYIIAALVLLGMMSYRFGVQLKFNYKNDVWAVLKEGKEVFSSNVALQISAYASTIILSAFINSYLLGVYTLAQKLVSVTKVILTVFFATMHQRVCNLISDKAYDKVKHLISTIYIPFLGLFVGIVTIIGALARPIFSFFTDNVNDYDLFIFRILLIVPVITAFNVVPYLLLLAHNYKREYASVTIPSAFFLIFLLFLLTPKFQIEGAVIALILNELFIIFFLFYKVSKTSLLKFYLHDTK